ncbi:MAG: T9SS type B sorting domain-containing protein [Polaribacter sp.]
MKKLIPFFLIFFALNVFSQKEANIWYFGENAGLDFSSGTPTVLRDGQMNTFEGCSTISDVNGVLQFYSDGLTVWDREHNIMNYMNGSQATDLKGDPSSTQSALVVPNPSDANIYYIFTVGSFNGFNYYTVDMSRNLGKGEVIAGPVDLGNGSTSWSEKVTAVQGDDCNSIWILSVQGNNFISYKIDRNGVDIANPRNSSMSYFPRDVRGYLKVSPDGKKVAFADYTATGRAGTFDAGGGSLVLLDFDTTTGLISNTNQIPLIDADLDGAPYGIEFSQLSSKLYVSTHNGTHNILFQFDLVAPDILGSKREIIQQTGYRGALQLAPDNKIYALVPVSYPVGTSTIDVIENPNDPADQIRYTKDKIRLGGGSLATQGLPPFIQSFFSPVNIIDSSNPTFVLNNKQQTVCIGDSVTMEPEIAGGVGSIYTWTKENDASVNITTRAFAIDNTNFGSGVYNLEMTIEDTCGRTKKYNSSVEINFIPKPVVSSIPIFEQCDFDTNPNDYVTNFNLESKESEIYAGTDPVNIDFFEESDTSFSTPLTKADYRNSVSTRTGTHKVVAKIQFQGSLCFKTVTIELNVNPSGIDNYTEMYTCELDTNATNSSSVNSLGSGNAFFDFDVKTNQIISDSGGALSLSTHNFRYYRTRSDARLVNNEIVAPYNDDLFTDNADVFIKVSLKNTEACTSIGQFKVFVQELPIPKGNTNTITLCVNNPVTNPQPFTVDLDASTGNAGDTYLWYFNNQLINGANGAIHKANQQGIYKVEAYRMYANNVTNTTDDFSCVGYNTFTVDESNAALIESIDFVDNQDNLDNNTITIKVSGKGNYEYAINDQTSSNFNKGTENLSFTFTNVSPGLNTIYINDIDGCGITKSSEVSFVYFQRFFTPNGDNILDTWKIEGIDNAFYKVATLQIFDRYGRFLKNIDLKTENGWNGLFNGKEMPENNYWYNATLIDINDKVRTKKGHFSLLRK